MSTATAPWRLRCPRRRSQRSQPPLPAHTCRLRGSWRVPGRRSRPLRSSAEQMKDRRGLGPRCVPQAHLRVPRMSRQRLRELSLSCCTSWRALAVRRTRFVNLCHPWPGRPVRRNEGRPSPLHLDRLTFSRWDQSCGAWDATRRRPPTKAGVRGQNVAR
jgi:hypothetical protein